MTDPVARAVSPRRTVRVAVALLAGQAALCAVIGWVTFGTSEAKPDAAGVNPLTKPIVFPTWPALPVGSAPAPPGASPSKAPAPAKASSSPGTSRASRPPTTRAASPSATMKPRPSAASQETGDVPASPPPVLALTPPSFSAGDPQSPVVEGTPCAPDGAEGLTAEQVELRCEKDADGDLVWQII